MIIPEDQRGYERVAILSEHAHEAHRPTWGTMRRFAGFAYSQPENLARQALVSVDSFFGTVNSGELADLYLELNQVQVEYSPGAERGDVILRLRSHPPNFAGYQYRFDGSAWNHTRDSVLNWALHPDENLFEVRVINTAGRAGKTSLLCLIYAVGATTADDAISVAESIPGIARPFRIPFLWEDFNHSRLVALREKYELANVVADAGTDLERVTRLRNWLKGRWDHSQPVKLPPWDALFMLERAEKGIEAYFCVHYSVAFMQCCLALGIPARLVNLHRGLGPKELDRRQYVFEPVGPPIDEHVVNEVWLNDLGRWVMMDVDFDLHYEREGLPLSALEIHQLFLEQRLAELDVIEGALAYKLKSSDDLYSKVLPEYYAHFCIFWRNNHLSDPIGPTQIMHWIDDKTPAMLWWEGSDLRHRPEIIGPAVVAWPYTADIPRLNDGNIATCWASAETPETHWVELRWEAPVRLSQVVLDWAECWQRYWTSRSYILQAWQDGEWCTLIQVNDQAEAAFTKHVFPPVKTDRLRVWQPRGGGPCERQNLLWLAEIEVYE